MAELPLVSIAAINYHNSATVIATLESIRNQTYPAIELIIVDDCSVEHDMEIISEWLKTYDGPHKLIRHTENRGVCATYNTALKNATGKYFSAIDTDDVMLPEKTARQVQVLEAAGAGVGAVYSDALLMDVGGAPLPGHFMGRHRQFSEPPAGNIYHTLLQGNFIPCMTMLIRKEVFDKVGGYDEQLVYEDYDMWLRIARQYEILFSDYISASYRIRPGSLTFTIKNWGLTDMRIFAKHAGAPLPLERIYSIVWQAYEQNDAEILGLLRDFSFSSRNRFVMTAWFLWHTGIPVELGQAILLKVKEYGNSGLPMPPMDYGPQHRFFFLQAFLPAIDAALLQRIVAFFYATDGRLDIIRDIAFYNRDIKWLYLYLAKQLSVVSGMEALLLEMAANETAPRPAIAGAESDTPVALFIANVLPILPDGFIKELAYRTFTEKKAENIPLLQAVEQETVNKYVKVMLLLYRYHIDLAAGMIIMERIDSYIKAGRNNVVIDLCIWKDVSEARRKYKAR